MSALSAFVKELRERRLWPVAAVLLVGIVAVPFVLAKSPAPTPVPPVSTPGLPVAANSSGPAISVSASPSVTPPDVRGRDPFGAPAGSGTSASSGGSGSHSTTASSGTTTSGAGTGSSGGGAGTGSGSSGSTTPATPPTPPHPAPAALTATQAYRVTLAINNSTGGLDRIDPLERLSVLPSRQHPLLIVLGVLQGGGRVLFVVQPGTAVSGPGSCTPGPIDCQILSLAPNQAETLSAADGAVSQVLFAVTGIHVEKYPSVSAADKARHLSSAAGRKLLADSTLSALSLFQYDPALGAVVDLRNLTVGGQ